MTKEFGELCREYREALGMSSSAELARRVEYDPAYIWRIEKGKQEPSRTSVKRLLKELQVPLERQAEFLLHAIGCPPERVEEMLIQAKQEINITRDLEEGEILEIKITEQGLELKKHRPNR